MKAAPETPRPSPPTCRLCSGPGEAHHRDVEDSFFGSPGAWTFFQCSDSACGLAWIEPQPTAGELERAYRAYYTHAEPRRKWPWVRPVYELVKRAHLARTLGYRELTPPWLRPLGALSALFPEKRELMEAAAMHLRAEHRGRALEIGCGNGNTLEQLSAIGWEAWGLDLDAEAIAGARQRLSLDLRVGTLEEQGYPDEHFDCVGSVHTFEHLPDFASSLHECHRILRRGGHLVVSTPNWKSATHRRFGPAWRGLEPPRHLFLFTRQTLALALVEAGFRVLEVRTTARGAAYAYRESARAAGLESGKLAALRHSYRVAGKLRGDPDAGDELLAIASRDE